MKKIISILFAACIALSSSAAITGSNIKLLPSDVDIDNTGRGTLVISIDTDITTLKIYIINLNLPEGFTIPIDEYMDYEIFPGVAGPKHSFVVGEHPGYYRIVASDDNLKRFIKTGVNPLLSINIQAPEDWNGESVECSISGLDFAALDAENSKAEGFSPENANFTIRHSVNTGIEEISADALKDAKLFDLSGMPISKPIPGKVIIAVINNVPKKVMVK